MENLLHNKATVNCNFYIVYKQYKIIIDDLKDHQSS